MTRKTTSRAVALAAVFAALPLVAGTSAFATSSATYPTQDHFLQTADEALGVVTRVRAARLALFDDHTDQARVELERALDILNTAEAELPSYMMRDFPEAASEYNFLPFDMSMTLTEDFQASEENAQALQQAQGLFESADPDAAVEVLKLAEIDVQVSVAMLPYETTMQGLNAAITDITSGEFYRANLDMKAIEDSIQVRTFLIDEVPAQGVTE